MPAILSPFHIDKNFGYFFLRNDVQLTEPKKGAEYLSSAFRFMLSMLGEFRRRGRDGREMRKVEEI